MIGILAPGDELHASSRGACRIVGMLGAGGQGEVYRATLDEAPVAVKWYYQHQATEEQRATLADLIERGTPDDRFLWPLDLVTGPKPGFGYLMALREPRYQGISALLARRVTPSFRTLATVGVHLPDVFLQLHAKGLCYRDISSGNVFFDPDNGNVLICDNDNVGPDLAPGGVIGTPRFMAPELVRREALPSTQTDLYSLSILLFLLLVNHHPLDGRRETAIHCFDLQAMHQLYGTSPLFIFDPDDSANLPLPGHHDNALAFWPIYPTFLRDLFTRAFTDGLRDPGLRVRETSWRAAMSRLRDAGFYCACGAENFYDEDALRASRGDPGACWRCQRPLVLPPRIRVGKRVVMLNHDSRLYRHHLDERAEYDFGQPHAEMVRHPTEPDVWGLRNCAPEPWVAAMPDGTLREVPPGRSLSLVVGARIHFGTSEAEVRC